MKIQLDTTLKIIKIEESVNLNDLFEMLNKILPNDEWKTFKIETNTTIEWRSNPIIIDRYYPRRYVWPWWETQPTVTYSNTINTSGEHGELKDDIIYSSGKLKKGIYQIEA